MSSCSISISDDEVYIIVDVLAKWQVGHLKYSTWSMAFKCKKGADIGYTMLLYGYLDLLIITMAFEACKQNLIKAINIYYKY